MIIKKVFLAFFLAMVIAFFTNPSQSSALNIDLSISDTDISVGETFDIEVWANDASLSFDEVLAFGFDIINSDSSIIRYDSYTTGDFFWDDSLFFSDTDVAGSQGLPPGITADSILLARLGYTAISDGDVTLGISSDILDLNEGLIYLWAGNMDITSSISVSVASASTPVPEPTTIFLMTIGMAWFAVFGRRFKSLFIKVH